MPWPYLSPRNKGRSSTLLAADDDGLTTGAASLSLEEALNGSSNSADRRAASLDIYRPAIQSLAPLTPSTNDKPKSRRSSFPRLALPSWRQSPSPLTPSSSSSTQLREATTSPAKSNSVRSSKRQSLALEEEDEGAVELQEGYGTPYTATGLKGGFQCISPQPSTLSGSSSIASTSSSSRRSAGGSSNLFSLFSSSSGASRTSDEYSLDTQLSSANSHSFTSKDSSMLENEATVKAQPITGFTSSKTTPDSGFADFGPHTIVEEEERKKALARELDLEDQQQTPSSRYRYQSSDDHEGGENPASREGGSNVTIPKKSRSKGWFSFNSSSKNDAVPASVGNGNNSNNAEDSNCCTPKNERNTPSVSTATVSIAESNSTSSTIDGNLSNQQTIMPAPNTGISTSKKIKQSASSKGMNMIRSAGRKRGDSEVSMKDMTASLRE